MTVFKMAKQYYPRLWDDKRIDALAAVGKLTEQEAAMIKNKGEIWDHYGHYSK